MARSTASIVMAAILIILSVTSAAPAADTAFGAHVVPFLKEHCIDCHGGDEPEAKLKLDHYTDSARIQTDFATWEKVLRIINARQMPPADQPQPSDAEFQAVGTAIAAELDKFDCSSERHPGRVTLRRLNRAEYNLTMRDLIGIDFRPADDFPSDDVGDGFDNIADVLTIPPVLLEKYLAAAEKVIDTAMADENMKSRIFRLKRGDDEDELLWLRRSIRDFASRAFRRPVSEAEGDRVLRLGVAAFQSGLSREEAVKIPLQAILSSPHFLFRVEEDPGDDEPDGIRELNDYELASRMSYFLWSSMPDDRLFELAGKGTLHQPDVIEAEVRRMLKDPKSRALVDNFAGQWLQLRDVRTIAPDPELFPGFDQELRTAMLTETEMFFASLIQEDRSVLEFLNADYTFVNEKLAKHYGMQGIEGSEFRKVSLTSKRRGILTQASILTLTSNPTRTSPVKRGKWILENMLGEPPPPPPAGVEELKEDQELLGTLRERMEQHRANPSCAVCHRQMDALGFGLENFNAVGAWRDRDGRFDIDPSGTLPGNRKFVDAKQLMNLLAEEKRDQFCRCLTEKMLVYALGRGLISYDRCAVREILERVSRNEFRVSALVTGIVLSDPFRMREIRRDD